MADSVGGILESEDLNLRVGEQTQPEPGDSKRITHDNKVTSFDASTIVLQPYAVPTQIVGMDPSRVRMLVRGSAADIYIGKTETLGAAIGTPNGYPVSTTVGDELRNTDEVYARWNPASAPAAGTVAYVSVFIERAK